MRVEQVRVRQPHLQQRLDDVTDGAVVRETDLLRRADEVPQTSGGGRDGSGTVESTPQLQDP